MSCVMGLSEIQLAASRECEETWLRLHLGWARQRDQALVRLMEANQSFSDSSEDFERWEGARSSQEDLMTALLAVEAGHWTSRGRQTEQVLIEGV